MSSRTAILVVVCLALGSALVVGTCAKPDTGIGNGSCAAGLDSCGTACVDKSSDPQNCGECGVHCQAGQECSGGSCSCIGSLAACGGTCTDTSSDPMHCG